MSLYAVPKLKWTLWNFHKSLLYDCLSAADVWEGAEKFLDRSRNPLKKSDVWSFGLILESGLGWKLFSTLL